MTTLQVGKHRTSDEKRSLYFETPFEGLQSHTTRWRHGDGSSDVCKNSRCGATEVLSEHHLDLFYDQSDYEGEFLAIREIMCSSVSNDSQINKSIRVSDPSLPLSAYTVC